MLHRRFISYSLFLCGWLLLALSSFAQSDSLDIQKERKFYAIKKLPLPDSVKLEVGGMAFMDSNRLAVCTRRGEVWIIENPFQKKIKPKFRRFAKGLHEPLGLAFHKGALYAVQRSELTRLTDANKDGKADSYQTVCSWPLSGNYHEYSYGPMILPNGDMIVTLNLSWVGRGESLARWRGWMMRITPGGKMKPYALGMRSPAGFGTNAAGDIFFAENQGDWIPTGKITHVEPGDFAGHPASLRWTSEERSPIKNLKREQFPDSIGSLHDFAKKTPHFKEAAVIFPHTLMGISTAAILSINNDAFGPFKEQLLIGDQGHSKIMRAYLEKVNGKYQGACFPFLSGFASGILRMEWGKDNSLFVGMTSRGWASTGPELYGLQQVVWKGATPFEIRTMKAKPNGFELAFTRPVNKKLAADVKQYAITGFTYSYHKKYGSPIIDQKECAVVKAELAPDGLSVRLYVSGLREGYVHQLTMNDVKAQTGERLLHNTAYYTLNAIPAGTAQDREVMKEMELHGHHDVGATTKAAGCGASPSKNRTTQPADWKAPDVVIQIGTKPGLKFDIETFSVPEGSKVKLIFNNNDDMLHNLVVTRFGKGEEVGKKAMELGLKGSELGYVPQTDDVLYNTCILEPDGSQAIYFVAPKAGSYQYICSFPGHFYVMKGVMKVTAKKK